MKDYHFEKDNQDFDTTIRLDHINDKLKQLEQTPRQEDDLGDKDAFLNAFESEHFETPPPKRQLQYDSVPSRTQRQEDRHLQRQREMEEPPFWNKRTIGLLTIGCIAALMLCFGLVKWLFFSGTQPIHTAEARPVLVQSVLDGGELLIYDIMQQGQKTVALSAETVVTDEKNEEISAREIARGDVLMLQMDAAEETVVSVSYGGDIKREEITGMQVDVSARELRGETRSFSYDQNAIFLLHEDTIAPSALEPCDVLEIYGVNDTVWSVNVLEYHGYITLANVDHIQNGTFRLDDEEEMALEEIDKIAVPEGTHTITIAGDNIESRTDSVLIESGEEFVYDMSKAQEKVGVLVVNANVSDYKLYVNGTLVDSTTPTVLPFGEYDVVILKNGYEEWNQQISLRQDTVTVSAHLEESVRYGTVVIACNEEDASVIIDGVDRGTAPLQISLAYGNHEIVVQKDGFSAYRETVRVQDSVVHVRAELS